MQPEVVCSPQKPFYAEKESLPLAKTAGRVAGEFVMCYPPGIPIIAPGERVTEEIIRHIEFAKEKGCSLQGTSDQQANYLQVIKE